MVRMTQTVEKWVFLNLEIVSKKDHREKGIRNLRKKREIQKSDMQVVSRSLKVMDKDGKVDKKSVNISGGQ